MNVLDNHDECYKHRVCNESFPCDICRDWDKNRREVIEKMIDKSLAKGMKKVTSRNRSLCVGGSDDVNSNPSVEAAVSNNSASVEAPVINSPTSESATVCTINIAELIEQQVKQQVQSVLKDKLCFKSTDHKSNVVSLEDSQSVDTNINSKSNRPHFNRFLPADDQLSIMESTDNISVHPNERLSLLDSNSDVDTNMPSCEFSEVPIGAPDSSDPFQWNGFVTKMAGTLHIKYEADESSGNSRTSYISSRLKDDNADKRKSLPKLPLEGTIIDTIKRVEKEAVAGHLKNRSVRGRDDKAFMVNKDDFNAFCSPPKLDDNIEEGLALQSLGRKSTFVSKSRIHIPAFHKELDNDFRKIDNSARVLLRAVSYGSMISAYLDDASCEDDRLEGRKALINCFRSMADLTSRIISNSVLSRRKVFLRNVNFTSKATEKKLMQLPVFGNQLFNGQYFETLHTSAENLRDAKETQNVYATYNYDKSNKTRDGDKNAASDFNRKRKTDNPEARSAKIPRMNNSNNLGRNDQFKDNFRGENFNKKDYFSRKMQGGGPKGFPVPRK